MEKETPNHETKKNHPSLNPTDLNQRQKRKKKIQIKKKEKIHHDLNRTDLNQRQ